MVNNNHEFKGSVGAEVKCLTVNKEKEVLRKFIRILAINSNWIVRTILQIKLCGLFDAWNEWIKFKGLYKCKNIYFAKFMMDKKPDVINFGKVYLVSSICAIILFA